MAKYVCSVCDYLYDEAAGIPEDGISPGTAWADLPEDWGCPLCGAAKEEFALQGEPELTVEHQPLAVQEESTDLKELSPLEVSALCSNLARACEKQYKAEEAALFTELAAYFRQTAAPAATADFTRLAVLIEEDLQEGFPHAKAAAAEAQDRGAMRALVWSEKVTRILKSLLDRYQKEGDAMLENTGVYVCTICGFIYVGDTLPAVCPVCKVPNWKFEKVAGRQDNE